MRLNESKLTIKQENLIGMKVLKLVMKFILLGEYLNILLEVLIIQVGVDFQ